MMKQTVFLAVICVFLCHPVLADTIYLKNGKKVEGEILGTTDKETKISVKGIALTYDAYDIDRVEKAPLQAVGLPPVKMGSADIPQTKTAAAPTQVFRPSTTDRQGQNASQQVDSPLSSKNKNQLILDLIDASGARENMNQMFGQIISQASPQDSDKLRGLFNVDEVVAQLAPIYDRYFTAEELKGLVEFYRSALGRKLLLTTPQIMQDSMETSMAYFQKKMEGITLSEPEGQTAPNAPTPGQGQ